MGLKKARCKLAQGRFQERIDAGTDKTSPRAQKRAAARAKPLAAIWTKELEVGCLRGESPLNARGVFGAFCVLIEIDSTRLR